jgi:molybdenum cofactor guanylyltransferase
LSSAERPGNLATAGFVLAGGLSSRMGTDKALICFDGEPLVARALSTLCRAGLTASIAGARTDLTAFGTVVEDRGEGPLSGICAGMAATSAETVVFLPVDLPLMTPSLLRCMAHHALVTGAPVTVASVNGFAQTFPVVLNRSVLLLLEIELQKGNRGCFAAFQRVANETGKAMTILPIEFLAQAGQLRHEEGLPPHLWLLNVNRPEELARAESIMAAHRRVC